MIDFTVFKKFGKELGLDERELNSIDVLMILKKIKENKEKGKLFNSEIDSLVENYIKENNGFGVNDPELQKNQLDYFNQRIKPLYYKFYHQK